MGTIIAAAADISAADIIGLLLGNGGLLIALILALISVVRGDWVPRKAHDATVTSIVAGKDAVIAEVRAQLAESDARAGRYEAMTLRLLHATEEATQVAREAVKRGAS